MTTQCPPSPLPCGVEGFQPCSSTCVPDEANWLRKNSVISSVGERRRWRVGRRTAIEPPWLVLLELPLHMMYYRCIHYQRCLLV